MVVSGVFGNVPTELRHLDFLPSEPFFECRVEDFALAQLLSVHEVRDGPRVVVDGEMYHFAVNEIRIGYFGLTRVQERLARICGKPRLAIIGAFLVECHINRIVARGATVHKRYNFLLLEILLELLAGTCPQPLIILDIPGLQCSVLFLRGRRKRALPLLVLAVIVEQSRLTGTATTATTTSGFQDGRIHKPDKSRNMGKGCPFGLEQVDTEPFNMRPVQILVGHEEDFPVTQFGCDKFRRVFATRLKSHNLLDFGNLMVLGDTFCGLAAHIEHFALHRVDADEIAVIF